MTHAPLEIFQLLDRFELLYPDNENLSDLRRAYIDHDMSSVFRLVSDKNKEDLRKLILQDNAWALWKVLSEYTDTQFVSAFKNMMNNDIEFDADCFSRGQLESKLWVVRTLEDLNVELGTIFLCAGWYATLATMLFESSLHVTKIRSFDIDPSTVTIAEIFNKPWFVDSWKFKAIIEDIHNIDFNRHTWQFWSNKNNRMSNPITDAPDTIINTSCEHIENFDEWYAKIPCGKLVVLQSNNYFEVPEHVNCSNTIADFAKQTPLTTELYSGELQLPKYKRFMRIGYK